MGSEPLILDTHVLLWVTAGERPLGGCRSRIDAAFREGRLAVSAITFWELSMLAARGRIAVRQPVREIRARLLGDGLLEVPVDGEVGIAAVGLEGLHDDPADRLIVATALLRGAVLVTADRRILGWDGPLRTLEAN